VLPRERGAGPDGILGVIILGIISGLVGNYLYDVLKIGIDKAYKKIKSELKRKQLKVNTSRNTIKKQMIKKRIEENEEQLQKIIEEETMILVNEYFNEYKNNKNHTIH